MEKIALVVLAAGLGKRMNSALPKALVPTIEKPLIEHVLESAIALKPERSIIVTGHSAKEVEACVKGEAPRLGLTNQQLHFAYQEKQLGTGDAVKAALPALEGFKGTVLILCADMPLVQSKTLSQLLAIHDKAKATLSLITLVTSDAGSYGRIVRDSKTKAIQKIVEAKDCSVDELSINEINAAIYAVDSSFLAPAIKEIKNDNAQKEFYLTDIVERASKEGQTITALVTSDALEIQGVNTPIDLAKINATLRLRLVHSLIEKGVIIEDPASCFVSPTCQVAPGAHLGPQVQLLGNTKIGAGVKIEGNAYLTNTTVLDSALIRFGVRAENAIIGEGAKVGPFAHLRPGTQLSSNVHIGNFVETKNATIQEGAKANHLSYLGDCHIGTNSNIGAGTITCNYDGYRKSHTEIGNSVFVGSNTSLVAPVTIEDGATIAAGSVITKRVEKDSLAITRAEQVSKSGWSKRKRDVESKR